MFTPATLRIAAILAILLSLGGLGLSLLGLILGGDYGGQMLLSALSWALLLWAAFIGFRLAGYKLYPNNYKKVGTRIYLIIIAFGLFLFVGVGIGLVLAVALLAALWGLKRNYDEWVPSEQEPTDEGA